MQKADEIIVRYYKFDELLEICEKYPDKDIVVDVPEGVALEYNTVSMCEKQLKGGNLYVRIQDINSFVNVNECQKHNLKFFWGKPVNNFYQLNALKELGVSQIYIDAPIFFQMPEVKKLDIKVRLVPNVCYRLKTVPHKDGLHGTWIRPEKLDIYEPYADVVEFYFESPQQELALFRLFAEEKKFSGDMNLLYFGFNLHMNNDLVYEGLDEMRLDCGQKCETPRSSCHMCEKVMRFEKVGRDWANEQVAKESQT